MATNGPLEAIDYETKKRQRRLLQNRQAAQHNRERNKARVSQLERNMLALSVDNETLKTKIEALRVERAALDEELSQLRAVIAQAPRGEPIKSGATAAREEAATPKGVEK